MGREVGKAGRLADPSAGLTLETTQEIRDKAGPIGMQLKKVPQSRGLGSRGFRGARQRG